MALRCNCRPEPNRLLLDSARISLIILIGLLPRIDSMKNLLVNVLTLTVLLLATLGCGLIDQAKQAISGAENSNTTVADQAVNAAVGEQRVGVAECDEVIELLIAQTQNPDDNFAVKAIKQSAVNRFRDEVKRRLEQSQTDKTQVVNFCREFRKNLQPNQQGAASPAVNGW